jgi:ribosomal protein S18 acetylase RimI-like enzyme
MTPRIAIRKPRWADIPSLVRLASQAFLENARYPVSSFADWQTRWRYVAEVDGTVAGFLFGRTSADGREASIGLLAVHPAFQLRGVGRALIAAIERDARKERLETVRVGTPFALGFYERAGYEVESTDYALVRELIGAAVDPPMDDGLLIRRCDFEDLDSVIADLRGDDRARFLEQFFAAYREDSSRIFIAIDDTERTPKVIGGAVGRRCERNRDLVEVRVLCGVKRTRVPLLGAIAYQASKEGVRWIGVRTRENRFADELVDRGYEIAHLPEWWTLYYLMKAL